MTGATLNKSRDRCELVLRDRRSDGAGVEQETEKGSLSAALASDHQGISRNLGVAVPPSGGRG